MTKNNSSIDIIANGMKTTPILLFLVVPTIGVTRSNLKPLFWLLIGLSLALMLWAYLHGFQKERGRAFSYLTVYGVTFLLFSVLYWLSAYQSLESRKYYPPIERIIFTSLMILFFMLLIWSYFQNKAKLKALRNSGLLTKYKLFNENLGRWDVVRKALPGLDGSSPEEQFRKQQKRLGWIPAAGLTFFLIRALPGSINWVILFFYAGCAIGLGIAGIAFVAKAIQLREWEREIGMSIVVDYEK